MPRKHIALLCLLALLGGYLFWKRSTGPTEKPPTPVVLPKPPPPAPEPPRGKLIGEKLLHNYAAEGTSARDDLRAVRRLGMSYVTLVKTHANLPIGGNADLADAFRGKNPYRQRFLPDTHPIFNSEGEMTDRWKTPLFIHPVSAGRWEIRSAGPDKKLWTDDDLQLQPDGKFVTGRQ